MITRSMIGALFGYTRNSLPKVINIAILFFMTPILFEHWGNQYAYYVLITALATFSSVIAQPLVIKYFEKGTSAVIQNISVFSCIYCLIILWPLVFYLINLSYPPRSVAIGVIFPYMFGALLLARAEYFRSDRVGLSAAIEAVFLVLKLPAGYFIIADPLRLPIEFFMLYLELCFVFEILILIRFARTPKTKLLIDIFWFPRQYIFNIKFALLIGITTIEVLTGLLDRIVIGKFLSPRDLIIYSFSLTAVSVIYIIPSQINLQSQKKYYERVNVSTVWRLINENIRHLLLACLIPFSMCWIVGEEILSLWLGDVIDEEELLIVFHLILVGIVGASINCICAPFSNFLLSRGKFVSIIFVKVAGLTILLAMLYFSIQANDLIVFACSIGLVYTFHFCAFVYFFYMYIRAPVEQSSKSIL